MGRYRRTETDFDRSMRRISALFIFAFQMVKILWEGLCYLPWRNPLFLLGFLFYSTGVYYVYAHSYHIDILCYFLPETIGWRKMPIPILKIRALHHPIWNWFYDLGEVKNFIIANFVVGGPILFVSGAISRTFRNKLQNTFDLAQVASKNGPRVKVGKLKKLSSGRSEMIVSSPGIRLDRYKSKLQNLESAFGERIESIEEGPRPGVNVIRFSSQALPKEVTYSELAVAIKKPYEFLVGQSLRGPVTQSLEGLPHMITAGTTGQGKTVFLRRAILSLLEGSSALQLYIVDLKAGLELSDFARLPNVCLATTTEEAHSVLKGVSQEMHRRMKYLADRGYKTIDPERDQKDVLAVVIDEASVLFQQGERRSSDYELIEKCRNLADEITKLARSSRIHVILATQKISQDAIDTRVQNNLAGRMCFRVNTLHSSLAAVDSDEALKLPDIPGRGIWKKGVQSTVVQVPNISEDDLDQRIDRIARDFQRGVKMCFDTPKLLGAKDIKHFTSGSRNRGNRFSQDRSL